MPITSVFITATMLLLAVSLAAPASAQTWDYGILRCQGAPPSCGSPALVPLTPPVVPPVVTPPLPPPPVVPPIVDASPFVFPAAQPGREQSGADARWYAIGIAYVSLPEWGSPLPDYLFACYLPAGTRWRGVSMGGLRVYVRTSAPPAQIRALCAGSLP